MQWFVDFKLNSYKQMYIKAVWVLYSKLKFLVLLKNLILIIRRVSRAFSFIMQRFIIQLIYYEILIYIFILDILQELFTVFDRFELKCFDDRIVIVAIVINSSSLIVNCYITKIIHDVPFDLGICACVVSPYSKRSKSYQWNTLIYKKFLTRIIILLIIINSNFRK